jgi:hypothetical protein
MASYAAAATCHRAGAVPEGASGGTPCFVATPDLICAAIRRHALLEFEYSGLRRIVAPYCHGFTKGGSEVLRAVQVGGGSRSGGLGFGKLWTVGLMINVRVNPETFLPDDPDYRPHDGAMERIHCRIGPALV